MLLIKLQERRIWNASYATQEGGELSFLKYVI